MVPGRTGVDGDGTKGAPWPGTISPYAVESTDARAARAVGDATGLVALRRLCHEIMPLDETRLPAARGVVAFWSRAPHDPWMAAVHVTTVDRWRRMTECLAEARAAGEIRGSAPDERRAGTVLAALAGFQVDALLVPHTATPDRQRAALDDLLAFFQRDEGRRFIP
ncbi:TetR family transcriptional regulator C-terminal domain-containing protein [Streptomyces heilongjiangensis]|uniref:TetR family transcriptional regulator C-terminal domain-containing protein n=1 Tax=Streptomyces heilongjiangensis TaxID=945052 RepID=A0ABW1AZ41_9ACTN|nr:TetR family transcriptional regulator C-terminal domain-containing protein [Streptomyces heilongjiangensis]MDC2947976.1 TetR family transcriptional regulator C-terminal domain-containing protein [Streptomyces heilongjiangensis]